MDVFGKDAVIGDFRLSDHGLYLSTFNPENTNDLGMTHNTEEQFVGKNPVPVYLGSVYGAKLSMQMTVIQDECKTHKIYFTQNEIREILGRLTGYQGYKKMYIKDEKNLENIYYNVRVTNVSEEYLNEEVVALTFSMECDSQFAWCDKQTVYVTSNNDEMIRVYCNTDDRYNYLLPKIIIKPISDVEDYSITNMNDNNRAVVIDEISAGEVVTMDSKLKTIRSSNPARNYSYGFNYKFLQLVNGENRLVISHPSSITLSMMLPRKVGIM